MTEVTGSFNVRSMVRGLTKEEEHKLVYVLKKSLGPEFGTVEVTDDEVAGMEIDTEVEVDYDDVISELSHWEKQEVYDELKDDFEEECDCEEAETFNPTTYTEERLATALSALWEARGMLTMEQIDRIEAITKEKYV